ncbi:MAG TPA: class I SAM-dependent methyltransferase [Rhabdochlamydiaceae bacterium]|jgi:hypothetical protein
MIKRFGLSWTLLLCIAYASFAEAKIAVVTFVSEESYFLHLAGILSKEAYCKKWGYDFICHRGSPDSSHSLSWEKIKNIRGALEAYDWVFWSSEESLILNDQISLEDFIDANSFLIFCYDYITDSISPNAFLVKKSTWSFDFLDGASHQIESSRGCELETMLQAYTETVQSQWFVTMLPQRDFNAYAYEVCGDNEQASYHPGDFLICFSSISNLNERKSLMWKYYLSTAKCSATLDDYLHSYGWHLTPKGPIDGYMTDVQKSEFQKQLKLYPQIRSILEIGFNAGHSAENFFRSCPNLSCFLSFDIQTHPYFSSSKEYFERRYGNRCHFIKGDSNQTVPEYVRNHPGEIFDLIYIDGNHAYWYCIRDIIHCKALASPHTILWVDDYANSIQLAVQKCVSNNLIKIDGVYESSDSSWGKRRWIQAHYLFE